MKYLKKIIKIIPGGLKFLSNYFNMRMLRRTFYAWFYKHLQIKKDVILYESFFGRGMLCGPYALFLEALSDTRMQGFKHIWAIDTKEELRRLKKEYKSYKNVSFVNFGKIGYIKLLATAGWLINNVSFPNYYTKKKGQVFIDTWHGIPLKTLGYDMPDGSKEVSNVEKNFLSTDYMISANPFLTEIYEKAYKLEGLYEGQIIEAGYPRLDILFRFSREQIFAKLEKLGVKPDKNKKIILFAPTWKGQNYAHADASVDCYFDFKERMERLIDTEKYQILIKPHQRVFQLAKDKLNEPFFVPAMVDANEILSVTDILISDFSSIFYDYLATGKPVLFYIEDVESYKEQRGMYHSLEHLPGPVAETPEALASLINNIENVSSEWDKKYNEIRQYANAYSDGKISKRIIDYIFFGNENAVSSKKVLQRKKKIYISRGKLLTNGITTSFINLLNNLNYDKYDVTVMLTGCSEDNRLKTYTQINPNARVLFRAGTFNMTLFENIIYRFRNRFGMKTPYNAAFEREWKRCNGDAKYDILVDFEGYNYFHQLLLLQNRDIPKYIWLHNDMYEEYKNKYEWLLKIFKTYKYFTGVVACGREIGLVNKEKLCDKYFSADKLNYAHNVIDFEKVLRLSEDEDSIKDIDGERYFTVSEAYYKEKRVDGELVREDFDAVYMPMIPETGDGNKHNIRFVTIGRLSLEKNHVNLIKGFSELLKERPEAYLYILGNGPMFDELNALTEKLGISDHVFIPGHVSNPYIVLKYCDCFILPSLHEGQPLVVNEARALQKPIILSDFSSLGGVSVENGQLCIGHETEDIYGGLLAFINGEVPANYEFDYEEYNRKSVEEFLVSIGAA